MGQNGRRQRFHVLRQHVVAAGETGAGLRRPAPRQQRARTGAENEPGIFAGGRDQRLQVSGDARLDFDLPYRCLNFQDLRLREHRRHFGQRVGVQPVEEHLQLILRRGVADRNTHGEAVELRFRQRVGSLVFDRVLGRDDHERRFEDPALAVRGNLMFAHAFEQRRLGPGRSAVDFVRQQDVGEHRAGPELELARARIVDRSSGDIRRQQVRRELDAAEFRVDEFCQRLRQRGFPHARHVVEQDVAARHERGQKVADHVGFPPDDPVQFGLHHCEFFDRCRHILLFPPVRTSVRRG
ncbi:hypothetical protein SDC9_142833 [bioreactor metagenome]|uniref:Uncharacterized protein n=1 Tax=bioreactor metagenome TaxID=1076179 RepID=A0A645E2R3_9ZZZZ